MTPASKEEIYLAKLCGENWELPYPASRLEYYYAKLCGMDVPLPAEPLTRPERYLAHLCGLEVTLPEPVSRKEMYMAHACGIKTANLPQPASNSEKYWYRSIHHTEIKSGTLPLSFISNGKDLIDYRIYGGDQSTGLLIDEQYIIPIICSGKNLLKIDLESQYIHGIDITVDDGRIICNGTATKTITVSVGYMNYENNVIYQLSGCPNGGDSSSTYRLFFDNAGVVSDENGRTFNPRQDYNNARVRLNIFEGYECHNLVFTPQIEKSETVTEFEPYHSPVTIIIPAGAQPLTSDEYLDYQNQARQPKDGQSTELILPPLPTFNGTTIIDALPQIKPLNISLQYYAPFVRRLK